VIVNISNIRRMCYEDGNVDAICIWKYGKYGKYGVSDGDYWTMVDSRLGRGLRCTEVRKYGICRWRNSRSLFDSCCFRKSEGRLLEAK
jgi:hypothetical protein